MVEENIENLKKKADLNEEDKLIEERKEKVFNYIKKNKSLIFVVVLIALVILGVYIRYLPLSDHGGKPGLWDITTNDYTLGPDLDPFLFLRYAKAIIANGSLPQMDMMRNVPLGFETHTELQMVAYMIVFTYKVLNSFGTYSANFAGAFMPVWIFALTIISFFFFVREIFIRRKDKETTLKANLIASIATAFMIVIPEFLSRTVAGIPEKESVGFFFMFLALYLFLRAWKSEKIINASIIAILSGAATMLMALSWGGVTYLYLIIGLSTFIAFILGKAGKKEKTVYILWMASAIALTLLLTSRWTLISFTTATSNLPATFLFGAIIIDSLIWNTKLKNFKFLDNIKLPKSLISIIAAALVAIVFSFFISPTFIIDQLKELNTLLINPTQGRWATTVAENRQPYLSEWLGSFGKSFFWMFLLGSILLFKKMLNKVENKRAWILTGLYTLFLAGLLFSRYAPHPAIFDGEGIPSKLFYYGSALILIGYFAYCYIKDHRAKKESDLESLEFDYIFIFITLVLVLFTARSAIRLIMVLAPIAPIFLSYLIIEPMYIFKNMGKEEKDKTTKIMIGIAIVIILALSLTSFVGFYQSIKTQSYNYVPYYYTFQWQEAMSWVRNNTPTNAVFAHWWDYGYWVQSIGNRATVTDGGNVITWWNYLSGRYVLTGDNQKDALGFLYNHNATHLLIDSSDIGKYGAFSQIGSDANFDRLSQGPVTLFSDYRNIQEKKDETIRSYNIPSSAGKVAIVSLEEDINFDINNSKITLFKESSGLMDIDIHYSQDNTSIAFKQPQGIFVTNNGQQQVTIPLRYLYYKNHLYDYGKGLNATAYIIQRLDANNGQLSIDQMGALIYISPRVMRGLLAQVYILNNSLGNFNNFKLVHSQPDFIIEQLNSQNAKLDEFVYYQGLRGPIKIWQIDYKGDEKYNPEYLLKTPPSSITWTF